MPRPIRNHGTARLNHLEDAKQSLYYVQRAVNQVQRLGITVNHEQVDRVKSGRKDEIVTLINEEINDILNTASTNRDVAKKLQKLGQVVARVHLD